jgi:MFS family permease
MRANSPAIRAAEAPVGTRRASAAFALLGTVQVTLIATMTIISVALAAIQQELHLSTSELALVNNAYPVSFCGLLLFGGRLGDLFGRRAMFLAGTGIFAVASAAAGLAWGVVPLLLARFGQGCGAALAAPAALALLSVVFPDPARRTRAVAVWGGLPVAGATTGLLLSGVMVEWASWRWAFAAPVAIALAVLTVTRRLLPADSADSSQRQLDVTCAVLATAGLSALCFGMVEAGERSWTSVTVLVSLIGGAGLLTAFVIVESRVPAPLVPLSFFGSIRRVVGLVAVVLASSGTTAFAFFLPLYFQQVRGFSPAGTSAAFLPYALAMFVGGWLAGRLVARAGHRIPTVAGLLAGAFGLFLVSALGVDTPYAGVVLTGMVVFPIGVSLLFSGGTVAVVDQVPDHQAGLAGGVLNTAMEGGPALGFAVLVSLSTTHTAGLRQTGLAPAAATTGGYGFALAVCAAAYLLLAVLAAIALGAGKPAATTKR